MKICNITPLRFLQRSLKQKVMPKRKQNYLNGDKRVTRTEQCIFVGERSLMTSHIRVGRGSKIAPKKGRYRVGQGR